VLQSSRQIEIPAAAVRACQRAIRRGEDPLGDRLCAIIPPVERRPLGAFYTANDFVATMTEWVLERNPQRAVDAGCGSGRFALALARQKRNLEIIAVDVDPLATLITRASFACQGHRRLRVVQKDYTRLSIPEIQGPTAFIGNPPYVRHHSLSPGLKDWARKEAQKLGLKCSALAGLHAYFYLKTASLANDGDCGAFITSMEWLDVGYGDVIRKLVAGRLGGRSLQILDPSVVAFDDAMTTAAITAFEVGGKHRSMQVRALKSRRDLGPLDRGRRIKHSRLPEAPRWTPLTTKSTTARGKTSPLSDIARVHRGVVTGNNRFFVLERARAKSLGIMEHCRPAVTSARQILSAGGVVRERDTTCVVLDLHADLDIDSHPELRAYLESGQELQVDRGYVASHRKPWWRIGIGKPAPIIASYMARQAPVFALNPDGLALINIAHGIFPHKAVAKKGLKALVHVLNSSRDRYRGSGRTYHGGLEKFEPGEMEALPIPSSIVSELA